MMISSDWLPTPELIWALVSMTDILNDPDSYPEEVVKALKELKAAQEKQDASGKYVRVVPPYDEMYRFPGYIISHDNITIRPDASEELKKEWMEHWNSEKESYTEDGLRFIF